jgi:iron complex transport system substrate-binding protein
MFRDLRAVAKAARVDAKPVEAQIRRRIEAVASRAPRKRRRIFCCEWFDPIFTTGHWVPELVELAGGRDILARPGRASRRVEWAEVAAAAPEVIVLMPCGFAPERTVAELGLLTRRRGWGKVPAVAAGEVHVVDGPSYFNGAGPRLADGLEIIAGILYPDIYCPGAVREGVRRLRREELEAPAAAPAGEVRRALLRKGTVYDEEVHPRRS